MRRLIDIVVVLAVLGVACGGGSGDAVESAETCTELAQVWSDGDQASQGFRDDVGVRLEQLVAEERARGNDAAAIACRLFLSGAGTEDSEEFFMEGES